ncbi:SUMF1/EgtB/PvdO family nonheme iron enzyme [Streptomyces varsoviensis]|uniref:SUMF1/EgtB/PvdO family nonheme iron enzyme n=1 Tax=Streptomyces varsoviensis TaxID=67373 RepID=UPI0009964A87|nr:SUMF1/EgtB/PvdO family nonheme iron enzyme [Streptomyces varsoviensis]
MVNASSAARPVAPAPLGGGWSRDRLARYFVDTWDTYETLFRGVADSKEAFGVRVHPFRLPLVFYLGHTASFYIQKLKLVGMVDGGGVCELDERMEQGVSPEDPDELARLTEWPDPNDVWSYRKTVRDIVLRTIETVPLPAVLAPTSPLRALLMGIEHENIHLHTSLPLIRLLPPRLKGTPQGWPAMGTQRDGGAVVAEPGRDYVLCRGGSVVFGDDQPETGRFRWDNEYGRRAATVDPFEVAPHPVTNGQFLEFVRAGGYEEPGLWTTHGARLYLERVSGGHPHSWLPGAGPGGYRYRGIFEDTEMPWDWPVEVSRHEAVAYANWAGASLISEEQFHALLDQEFGGVSRVAAMLDKFDVGLRRGSPRPVRGQGAFLGRSGIDFVGNVALWLEDDFTALERGSDDAESSFRVDPLYPDFSEPWFGPETGMLTGASYAARGHMADVGVMRDFMQNHMDQLAGILLTRPAR